MPRTARAAMGGVIYHVYNSGKNGKALFRSSDDFQAYLELLIEGTAMAAVEVFGFCLMPNYWHIILRPRGKSDLSKYMSWVANTHVKRNQARHKRTKGSMYKGRYESVAVQEGADLIDLLRYVESVPLRARVVEHAADWAWSSLGCDKKLGRQLLAELPVQRPDHWKKLVNKPMDKSVRQRLETCLQRGCPLGTDAWAGKMAKKMGIEHKLRPIGRPKANGAG